MNGFHFLPFDSLMKKIILCAGFFCASAAGNSIEFGWLGERYNAPYKTSDFVSSYLSTTFKPNKNKSLNIYLRYSYQHQYGKNRAQTPSARFKTNRDRVELILSGLKWQKTAFTFAPKFGFKYEQWAINKDNPARQNKQRLEPRFYPNMNYKLSRALSLYFNGFLGPIFTKTDQEARKDPDFKAHSLGTNDYYRDYAHQLEFGFKRTFKTKNAIWASLYNEIHYLKYYSRYQIWQLRLGYYYHPIKGISINPFIRQDLYNKEQNLARSRYYGAEKSRKGTRVGATMTYKINTQLTLISSLHYKTAIAQNYNGKYADNKHFFDYKIALRWTF